MSQARLGRAHALPAARLGVRHRSVQLGVRRPSVRRSVLSWAKRQDTTETKSPQLLKDSDPAPRESDSSSQQGPLGSASRLLAEIIASPIFYLVAGLAAIKIVSSLGENSYGIFALAAFPVTALTLLSKSSAGQQAQDALAEQLPRLEQEAAELRAAHAQARSRSPWYGPDRPRWSSSAPHLRGEAAGDYGFDPLGLAAEPGRFPWMYEAELLHARWAMMGAVGCLVPEALNRSLGVQLGEPVWWKVGAETLKGDITINWGGIEGFRIAGKQGIWVIAACQAALMGGPEYARYVGIKSLEPVGVFLPGDQTYPGGTPFDPLNLSKQPDYFVDQAVREIKNGRLAMVAMLGYFVQAAVTRKGPVENLLDFLSDPAHNNIFAYLQR